MGPQFIRLAAALAFAGLAVLPASATVLVPAGVGQLAREAALIVQGRVVDVRGVWTEGRRGVVTIVTVEVAEAIKGEPGEHVSLRVPGGEMGRYRSVMSGAPTFRVGEEVVLFLGGRAPALPHLLGLGQGVYRVRRDASGQPVVNAPSLAGGGATEATRIVRGDPGRRAVRLAEFTRQVRELASGGVEKEKPRRRPNHAKVIR